MTESINGNLYPDVASAGGLMSAMEAAARKQGVDLGRIHSEYTSGPGLFVTAEIDSPRGRISVSLGDRSREFYLGIRENRFIWADGITADLDQAVAACAAWRGRMPSGEFAERFPFMTLGRLAGAREAGESIPAQWTWLKTSDVFIEERPLVEAFHEDGRFNEFFPNLSHGTLRLSTNHGVQGAREVCVTPTSGDTYRVEDTGVRSSARTAASLQEALAVAAEFLTAGRSGNDIPGE
ncbi:hypothetical protein GTW69_43600 [Streptomyces sp. SID7760]|nr:hypothetical protein [Streptomyces sp. SID7760]